MHDIDTVIAIDPHKASWSAAVVVSRHRLLGEIRVPTSRDGYRQLRRWSRAWPAAGWAIEGVSGLGQPLARRLAQDGIEVIDIPAKISARIRQLATGHGRKTDQVDAFSVGVAALTNARQSYKWDDQAETLRMLSEHRDDLVQRRTQVVNRLHSLLRLLVDGGAGRSLTATTAGKLLSGVRPRSGIKLVQRQLALSLLAELRHLDRLVTKADHQLKTAVNESRTQLLELHGIGPVLAAKIVGRTEPLA